MSRARLGSVTLAQFRQLAKRESRERFERLFAAQLRALKLPVPRTQFAFATSLGRDWRADFAWPDAGLLAEVNGGVWRKNPKTGQFAGAHSHPSGILRDWNKLNDAAILGWRVLQLTTDQVRNGAAVSILERALALDHAHELAPERAPVLEPAGSAQGTRSPNPPQVYRPHADRGRKVDTLPLRSQT